MPPKNLISNTNQGRNADFFLNGIEVTRSSNIVNNIISGITSRLPGRPQVARAFSNDFRREQCLSAFHGAPKPGKQL